MRELVENIEKGNLVIVPTDTVYGISADACNEEAIKKVFIAKKREEKPLIVMVSSIEMLKKYVKNINELEQKLIDKYWPNTLTILFKKNDKISDELTKGSEYIGIRIPNNKFLLELINEIGKPLISTSANITNKDVITDISLIEEELKNKVSYIYDGGRINDVASTIIKVEDNKIIFLREGVLSSKIKKDFKQNI